MNSKEFMKMLQEFKEGKRFGDLSVEVHADGVYANGEKIEE